MKRPWPTWRRCPICHRPGSGDMRGGELKLYCVEGHRWRVYYKRTLYVSYGKRRLDKERGRRRILPLPVDGGAW